LVRAVDKDGTGLETRNVWLALTAVHTAASVHGAHRRISSVLGWSHRGPHRSKEWEWNGRAEGARRWMELSVGGKRIEGRRRMRTKRERESAAAERRGVSGAPGGTLSR